MHQGHSIKAKILGENTHVTVDGLCQDTVCLIWLQNYKQKKKQINYTTLKLKRSWFLDTIKQLQRVQGGNVQMVNLRRTMTWASGDSAERGTCISLATGDQPLVPGKGGKRGPTQHIQMTTWSKAGLRIHTHTSTDVWHPLKWRKCKPKVWHHCAPTKWL